MVPMRIVENKLWIVVDCEAWLMRKRIVEKLIVEVWPNLLRFCPSSVAVVVDYNEAVMKPTTVLATMTVNSNVSPNRSLHHGW
jgi:DNA-binding transcriptional regulator of glucitol operon